MVRRLVEDQDVWIVGGEFSERGAATLAAAQIADF